MTLGHLTASALTRLTSEANWPIKSNSNVDADGDRKRKLNLMIYTISHVRLNLVADPLSSQLNTRASRPICAQFQPNYRRLHIHPTLNLACYLFQLYTC